MHRRVVTAWVIVALLSVGASNFEVRTARAEGPAAGSEQAARDAFERGRVFYDAGQFDQASTAFEEAYRLSGRDGLLYNIYLANRDANQQERAASALRDYLAKVPNVENRAQLEARLSALEAGLARQREQERKPVASVVAAPAPIVVAEPARPEASERSWKFYAGVSLAAAGGAALVGSLVTGLLTKKKQSELEDACVNRVCDASLADTADSGKRLARVTDGLLFSGIALSGAGAALLVFGGLRRGERRGEARTPHAPRVTAACSFDGCLARTTLRF